MRTVVGRLGRQLRLTHADGDLSPSQREVLGTVARRGPVRAGDLAALEGLNPTMLSRIVSELMRRDLVARDADPADGRAAILSMTPAGRRLHQRMRDERTDALRMAFDSLDPADRSALEAALPALERMVDRLRDGRG
jgi:DNA-binding MarR family transcriptional regulator